MSTLSFILDIIPVLGGIKMLLEAFFKKEMGGAILIGNARFMHLVFAIISILLDFGTLGIGGSLFRVLGKGFLKRWAVKIGGDVAGKTVAKIAENRIGRMAINSTERRIKRGIEHTIGDVKGYRADSKQREAVREKYGINVRNQKELKNISENGFGSSKIKSVKQGWEKLLSQNNNTREGKIKEQQSRKLNADN